MATKNPRVALTVSIPVKMGGYTGQREDWEEVEREYKVSATPDTITLSGTYNPWYKITFDRAALQAALEVLARYDEHAKPKPVMRGE
jgi:hypothetical protein